MEINANFHWLLSFANIVLTILTLFTETIERMMFQLVQWYDVYMYTPLQIHLSPSMARIPRFIQIQNKTITVFTANLITYARTLLIVPIAWCLKYDYPFIACLLVLFHDFLDHVDGIVAKVQKRLYGSIDDPVLGGFLDAFCDKIVNVFSLWTILQETHFHQTSLSVSLAFILLCYTIIALEIAIGVVRVQDYFAATMGKYKMSSQGSTAAAMEGKLKEKLESMGLAFLCLSTGHLAPFEHWSGIAGMICFTLTIRLAYASLMKKLDARKSRERKKSVRISLPTDAPTPASPVQKTIGIINAFNLPTDNAIKSRTRAMTLDTALQKNEKQQSSNQSSPSGSNSNISNARPSISLPKSSPTSTFDRVNEVEEERHSMDSSEGQDEQVPVLQRSASLPAIWIDARADKVYTIGCFDLFHEGHRLLLQRMRQFGREVIVGVHDSRSIFKLKSRVPVDGTETRMINVKRYADQVYSVAGTDPSTFVTCIVYLRENETALYVRGDDMSDFPSRHVVEELMPVKFLPYTNGVSSTKLRQELFSHIQPNDMEHLDHIN